MARSDKNPWNRYEHDAEDGLGHYASAQHDPVGEGAPVPGRTRQTEDATEELGLDPAVRNEPAAHGSSRSSGSAPGHDHGEWQGFAEDRSGQNGSSSSAGGTTSSRAASDLPASAPPRTQGAAVDGTPEWGAPAEEWMAHHGRPSGARWTPRKTLATAAIAVAVTGGATAAAFGLSEVSGSGSSSSQGPGGQMGGGQMGGGQAGGSTNGGTSGQNSQGQTGQSGSGQTGTGQSGTGSSGTGQSGSSAQGGTAVGGAGTMGALHSESVVKQDGKYVTQIMQTGTVTSLGDGKITVKSSDDYSKTYTVKDSSSTSDFSKGDTVTVMGTESGSTTTLESATEGSTGSGGSGSGAMPGGTSGSSGTGAMPGGAAPGGTSGQSGSGTGTGTSGNSASGSNGSGSSGSTS